MDNIQLNSHILDENDTELIISFDKLNTSEKDDNQIISQLDLSSMIINNDSEIQDVCYNNCKLIRMFLSNFYRNIEISFTTLYKNDFDVKKSIIDNNIFYYYSKLINEDDKLLYDILINKYSEVIFKNISSLELKDVLEETETTLLYKLVKDYNDIEPLFIIDEYNKLKSNKELSKKQIKKQIVIKVQEIYDYYNTISNDFETIIIRNYYKLISKNGHITKELWNNFLYNSIILYWKCSILLLDKNIIAIKDLMETLDNKITITDYINCFFNEKYTLI